MNITDIPQVIALATKTIASVTKQVKEAKADDGKLDSMEALGIFSEALLAVVSGVVGIIMSKTGEKK